MFVACTPEVKTEAEAENETKAENKTKGKSDSGASDDDTINLFAYTDETETIIKKYISLHPELNIKLNSVNTNSGSNEKYQTELDKVLAAGGKNAPDIYAVENSFVLKYSQGSMEKYAMPYKDLGINIGEKISAAKIANYTVTLGSNSKGEVVGLCYQTTGGCFIYRRSIAEKVFGDDDPSKVQNEIGGVSNSWDKFKTAAASCNDNNVKIISGIGDIWIPIAGSADKGWIDENGKLYIDPKRESFLDFAKDIIDNKWSNNNSQWTQGWYDDMKRIGENSVLGFFGPAWFINYTIVPNCGPTNGDWAVCSSPVGFTWGGTHIFVNKSIPENKKAIVKDIIEWITLDYSTNGFQYMWANGDLTNGNKDTVASGSVMPKVNGEMAFLGGQNLFDYYAPANQQPKGDNVTLYDEVINNYWLQSVRDYSNGAKSRDAAIADFKKCVLDNLGIQSE